MTLTSMDRRTKIDIIIPSYDNIQQLCDCVRSMVKYKKHHPLRLIIVNNGRVPISQYIEECEDVVIVETETNLGWTGGLAEGLKHSTSEYVMFANDDIFVPGCSRNWLRDMVRVLQRSPHVAAVGPSSNCVMGLQNMWTDMPQGVLYTKFLIGFCILVNREILDKCGGVQPSWETGDDIDLSMRFASMGYSMCIENRVFIYHHGFQTGERVYGGPSKPGGWNSQKMSDDTDRKLIQTHGFMKFWMMKVGPIHVAPEQKTDDIEGELIRTEVGDAKNVVDLGCGDNKTVEWADGFDAKEGVNFNAGIPAPDGKYEVVIGRHILEHIIDPVRFLEECHRIMQYDGRLILAIPDEDLDDTIPLDIEHKHAYTVQSLKNLVQKCGFIYDRECFNCNNVSSIVIFKRSLTS